MQYDVHYRRADGKGTQTYMTGLASGVARQVKQKFFDQNEAVTMCWVLDEDGDMVGDALTRDPVPTSTPI